MLHKKDIKTSDNGTLSSVEKEMGKPRMARSARIAERNLDTTRTARRPSITMTGTVDKIIPPQPPAQTEGAQIAVEGRGRRHQDLRIENALTDENGDDVKLKKGAHVDVTVAAKPKASTTAVK